ncbi:MAG: hypothetical protein KAY24_20090 [Candidatus Eisenbacteria sp.]|nr:hypothetical protein [Candidatus Eisenbacteria bacterium]
MTMDFSPTGAARFARTKGRVGGSGERGISYPSPFFDIGHTYLPTTVKQMFRWCRYYFMVHPLINSVVFKMSQYPITDLVYNTKDEHQKTLWKGFMEDHLRYRSFMLDGGLDYHAYGNLLVSIFFPFKKMLSCTACNYSQPVKDSRYYFRNFEFYWECPKCGHHAPAKVSDQYIKSARGIRLLRWNPEDVDIRYNDLNGEYAYYYEIPVQLKNDIIMGKKHVVEDVPQVFIDALRKRKAVVFSKDNIFHFKRPTLAGKDRGWGMPLLLPVLKDAFYLQILKKSQEAIALGNIVPLRILFPQSGSATSDPYCLSFRTLTEANLGYTEAGKVKVGDLVKTFSGRYQPVTVINRRRVRPDEKVYRINICGMSAAPIEPSEDHPLFAVRTDGQRKGLIKDWTPDWIAVRDLQVGDYVAYPLTREVKSDLRVDISHYRRGHRTSQIPRYLSWSKHLATIVGYYLAEGSGGDHITFSLNRSGGWICDELDAAFMAVLGKKGHRRPRGENGLQYEINDSIFGEFLQSFLGLAPNKRLPKEVVYLPEEILLELVRCLINGDGGGEQCYRDNGTGCPCRTSGITLTSTSRDLAFKLRELLLYLRIIGRIHTVPGTEDRLPIYRVKIDGADAVELWGRFGWDVPAPPIKQDTTRSFIRGDYAFFRVQKKVEIHDVDFVYGFQVDGDKSFCVPACATHNTSINLGEWKDDIQEQIARWRSDQNYIPILPLPVGNQTIGGDGRALLLGQEIRIWSEHIVTGMGVPQELIFGGVSFSGSNVSLRMLENIFLGYMTDHGLLMNWVVQRVASYMDWEPMSIKYKPFKMADDLQRKAYNFQLNQAGKISDGTLLEDADFDPDKEDKKILGETDKRAEAQTKAQLAQAEIQGKAQMVMMRYQIKSQKEQQQMLGAAPMPGEPGAEAGGIQPGQAQAQPMEAQAQQQQPPLPQQQQPPMMATQPPQQAQPELPPAMGAMRSPLNQTQQTPEGAANVDLLYQAQQVAQQLVQMDENSRLMALMNLRQQSPEFYQVVLGILQQLISGGGPEPAAEPLPEQRPPQRAAGSSLI